MGSAFLMNRGGGGNKPLEYVGDVYTTDYHKLQTDYLKGKKRFAVVLKAATIKEIARIISVICDGNSIAYTAYNETGDRILTDMLEGVDYYFDKSSGTIQWVSGANWRFEVTNYPENGTSATYDFAYYAVYC